MCSWKQEPNFEIIQVVFKSSQLSDFANKKKIALIYIPTLDPKTRTGTAATLTVPTDKVIKSFFSPKIYTKDNESVRLVGKIRPNL